MRPRPPGIRSRLPRSTRLRRPARRRAPRLPRAVTDDASETPPSLPLRCSQYRPQHRGCHEEENRYRPTNLHTEKYRAPISACRMFRHAEIGAGRAGGRRATQTRSCEVEKPQNARTTGAGGGIRTLMTLRSADFESAASAIPPLRRGFIVAPPGRQGQGRSPDGGGRTTIGEYFSFSNCEAVDLRGLLEYITA